MLDRTAEGPVSPRRSWAWRCAWRSAARSRGSWSSWRTRRRSSVCCSTGPRCDSRNFGSVLDGRVWRWTLSTVNVTDVLLLSPDGVRVHVYPSVQVNNLQDNGIENNLYLLLLTSYLRRSDLVPTFSVLLLSRRISWFNTWRLKEIMISES